MRAAVLAPRTFHLPCEKAPLGKISAPTVMIFLLISSLKPLISIARGWSYLAVPGADGASCQQELPRSKLESEIMALNKLKYSGDLYRRKSFMSFALEF